MSNAPLKQKQEHTRRSLRAFTAGPLASVHLRSLQEPRHSHYVEVPVLGLLQVPRAATLKCGQGAGHKGYTNLQGPVPPYVAECNCLRTHSRKGRLIELLYVITSPLPAPEQQAQMLCMERCQERS